MKTYHIPQSALAPSLPPADGRKRIMASYLLRFAAILAVVLGLVSLASGAIVMNGNFELEGVGPTDALFWTGENGTTIVRMPTGGVSGSAGGLVSNTTPVSAAGPF